MNDNSKREILFDFDGTLAYYDRSVPYSIGQYGEPVEMQVNLAKAFIADGYNVKVFTARLDQDTIEEERLEAEGIMDWCRKNGLVNVAGDSIPVTNRKTRHTYLIYDDRAVAVRVNDGETFGFRLLPLSTASKFIKNGFNKK